jgi:RNA polymerase sigma-70 factor (ECF subfamily)
MARYAAGDDAAFTEMYALLAPSLHRLCTQWVGRGDADDALQEVFIKMHRARGSFVAGGNAHAWSCAIARSTCIDRLRHKSRRPERHVDNQVFDTRPHPNTADSSEMLDARRLQTLLEQRLAELSDSLRTAYLLVQVEGLDFAEAGGVLGTSAGAVKQRVHRATEQLRAALAESHDCTQSLAACLLP